MDSKTLKSKADIFNLPDDLSGHVAEQLVGMEWGQLEVLEHAGYLLFPEKIFKRQKDGEFKEQKVLIRVPREHEIRKARVTSRRIAKEAELDLKLDADLVENIEDMCLLSIAIRNVDPPHEPWEPNSKVLEKQYDTGSLAQIYSKVDAYRQLINPQPDSISQDEMLALISAISKERSIVPLLAYGPESQTGFIVTMASHLASLMESK